MTELLVGTKKGLFRLEGDAPGTFEVTARAFAGQSVEYAMRDPRTGRYLASVTSWFYGPKIWVTDDALRRRRIDLHDWRLRFGILAVVFTIAFAAAAR